MAIELNNDVRTGIADLVADAVDAGTSNAEGQLVFLDSDEQPVAVLPMNNPAFGSAVNGVVLADVDPQPADINTAGGVITHFELQDRDENWVIRGTANAVDGDIILTSDTIGNGETLQLVSMSYTAPDGP